MICKMQAIINGGFLEPAIYTFVIYTILWCGTALFGLEFAFDLIDQQLTDLFKWMIH